MTPTEYEFKTKPFAHQAEAFSQHCTDPAFALFWEQGCGKTKPTIDTAAFLFERGDIDALLVVAPNGVHRNWISDELPTHLPERVKRRSLAVYLQPDKTGVTPGGKRREHQRELDKLMALDGLAILAVSYDSFATPRGKAFLGKFMRARRCLMVLDESHYIKNPQAIRTKLLLAASEFSVFRRALTGTPVAQGPFDVYSQVKFLDNTFWSTRGFKDFHCFKSHFGIFQSKPFGPGGRMIETCVGYRNLEQLQGMLKDIGHRLTKEDALDLPPKVYTKRYYDMSTEQAKAYGELKEQLFTELASGEIVEAQLAIVKLLRFQQIVCGYVGDVEGNVVPFKTNPRLEVLKDITDNTDKPGIIWARFTNDIDQIMAHLGDRAVRYDGSVSADARAVAKERFQKGEVQWFVGNQAAGATGLTLTRAKTVVYYSNSFRLVDRLQSEDRAHRIGQDETVHYVDIVCNESVDERVVSALRNKLDIASTITGDNLKEWI